MPNIQFIPAPHQIFVSGPNFAPQKVFFSQQNNYISSVQNSSYGQGKPAQFQPAQFRPAQVRPAQVRPAQVQRFQVQPVQVQPVQVQPVQVQPVQVQYTRPQRSTNNITHKLKEISIFDQVKLPPNTDPRGFKIVTKEGVNATLTESVIESSPLQVQKRT